MTNQEIQLFMIKMLGNKYPLFIDSYPDDIDMENFISVTINEERQLNICFYPQNTYISIYTDYPSLDDRLLDVNEANQIIMDFKKEKSPFDTLTVSDEHNGLRLIKFVTKEELKETIISELIEYLEKPNQFLIRLYKLTNFIEKEKKNER